MPDRTDRVHILVASKPRLKLYLHKTIQPKIYIYILEQR